MNTADGLVWPCRWPEHGDRATGMAQLHLARAAVDWPWRARRKAQMIPRLALVWTVAVVAACATVPRPPIPKFSLPQVDERLANGMRLIVLPDPMSSVATLDVRIDAGAA